MGLSGFDERLARERRARLQAEHLLAQRSHELYSANKKLEEHAYALSYQVIEQREENAALVGRTSQTQAELEIANEKAVVAERRLWDSLRAFEDGFAVFDRDWRLVAANDAFKSAFDEIVDIAPGASYEAILRIAVEEGVVDLEGEASDDWINRMMTRWEQPSIPQVDIKLWNGAFVRLLDKRSPDGDVVCIALDITTTVRRERELRKARDEAETAARAKSAFLANMSHEIRTPMNGVVSMAELLRETDLTEEQQLYAETIHNSGEALLAIIKDVLDFSKIDANKLVLHSESFDLQLTIQEIFRLLEPGMATRNVVLRLDYDIFLPDRMIGDPGRLRQILINLIGNAVKFTESGEVLVRVVSDYSMESQGKVPVQIMVQDTGIGIPKDLQAHVFGEFNQVESDANRRFDGTGLGLAITKRLVELMGGQIWLESEPGVGSSFNFTIQLDADPEAITAPVPPLPAGRNLIHAIVGHVPLPDLVLAHLMRLRANLQEGRIGTMPSVDTDAVLIGAGVPDVGEIVRQLREAGICGPVLVLGDAGGAASDAPGVVIAPPNLDLRSIHAAFTAEGVSPHPKDPPEPFEAHVVPEILPEALSGPPLLALESEISASSAETRSEHQDWEAHPSHVAIPSPELDMRAMGPLAEALFFAPDDPMEDDDQADIPEDDAGMFVHPAEVLEMNLPQVDGEFDSDTEWEATSDAVADSATMPEMSNGAEPPPMQEHVPVRRLRLLAAEDNKTNQLVFKTMLKSLQLDLMLVENGRLAVEAFEAFLPDVLFTDISMPEMDGIAAAQAIRALERAHGLVPVPIIAMTAHASDEDRERILASGINGYMTKPLKKADLHKSIRDHAPEGLEV